MATANNNLTDKLDYIGLNLDKIPKFITEVVPLNYKSSPMMNDNEHKIFKYIPIHEIQILISPTNRLTDIKEKYSKARPLADYLEQKNIEEYATFLNMLNTATIEGMEEVEARQKKLNKNKLPIPSLWEGQGGLKGGFLGVFYLLLNKSFSPSISNARVNRRVWSSGLLFAVAMT